MRVLLEWITFFLMALVLAAGVAIAVFSHQLRRQNRVDPETESLAPVVWLWSPVQAARLHRRLRAAATAVYVPPTPAPRRRRRAAATATTTSPADELSRGLRAQATTLDAHLVTAARLPRTVRRQQLRVLQPQVIEVERLATRLLQHRRRVEAAAEVPGPHPTNPSPPEALAAIAGQLDVLEQAHDELFAIERANGLLDPDAVMQRITPPTYAPRLAPRSTRPPTGPPVSTAPPPAPPPAGRPSGPPAGPPVAPPSGPPVGPPVPGPPPGAGPRPPAGPPHPGPPPPGHQPRAGHGPSSPPPNPGPAR